MTHCKNGHELISENTYLTKQGYRICRICQKDNHDRWIGARPGYHNNISNKSYHKDFSRAKSRYIKYRYGITMDQYNKMLTDQHGACAICWESFENETPVIEHCHETGKVRGLTHQNCNAMIGLAKENPQILRLGALYIEKHKG